MLTQSEIDAIIAEVEAGTYDVADALVDIAQKQKGEDVRKALYSLAYTLEQEGKVGSVDLKARDQIAAIESQVANWTADHSGTWGETELWSGEAYADGAQIVLQESCENYDYIDVHYTYNHDSAVRRFPAAEFKDGAAVASSGVGRTNTEATLTEITIMPSSLDTPDGINFVLVNDYWTGTGADVQGMAGTGMSKTQAGYITAIVGVKLVDNAELVDLRTGVDGRVYTSAGQAVRSQIWNVKDKSDDTYETVFGGIDTEVSTKQWDFGIFGTDGVYTGYADEGVGNNAHGVSPHNRSYTLTVGEKVRLSDYSARLSMNGLYMDVDLDFQLVKLGASTPYTATAWLTDTYEVTEAGDYAINIRADEGMSVLDDTDALNILPYMLRLETGSSLVEDVEELKDDLTDIEEQISGGGIGVSEALKVALLDIANHVYYDDGQGDVYYNALHDALYPDTPPATVVSISAAYTPSGNIYDTDSLDKLKENLVVTATWSDDTTSTVPNSNYTLSGILSDGVSTITVTFSGKTTTFTVEVIGVPSAYTALDYVTFDGSQYANSGIYESATMLSAEYKYEKSRTDSDAPNYHVFSSANTYYPYISSDSSTIWKAKYNGTESANNTMQYPWKLNVPYTVFADFENRKSGIDGEIINDDLQIGSTYNASNQYTIGTYGGSPSTTKYRLVGKIYYMRFYNSSGDAHYFRPVKRVSDDVVGFYDLITDRFITAATGSFSGGYING